MNTDNWQVTADIMATPNFGDVSTQSPEQQQAFQTWVNTAINMLNRGKTDMEVLAQLSHDGCPDSQTILMRAKGQPFEEQQPTEEDLSGVAQPNQDIYRPESESMAENPVQASITREVPDPQPLTRVMVAGMTGTEIGRFDSYGQEYVRVALDNGDEGDFPSDEVHPSTMAPSSTVSQIQAFIDSLPEVNAFNVQSHVNEWRRVQAACKVNIPDAKSDQDRDDLVRIHALAERNLETLASITVRNANDEQYLSELPEFEVKVAPTASQFTGHKDFGGDGWAVYETAQAEAAIDVRKAIREGAALWVHELEPAILPHGEIVADSAIGHLASLVGKADDKTTEAFLAQVEKHRVARLAEIDSTPTPKQASVSSLPDGPDEAIFW